ncbi:MAG TPA: hypothetical protein VII98_11280 [Solirubrobacteraceae bacterium]
MTSRSLLIVAALIAVLALGACGSSSSSKSSSSSSTPAAATTGSSTGTSTDLAAAQKKCLDQASQLTDATAKSVATSACKQISSSNTNITDALSKAKTACLNAVAKLPSVLQGPAKDQCNKISG